MPWFEIPASQIQHLSLFGYGQITDLGEFMLMTHSEHGDVMFKKTKPVVWLEDAADAMQIGAKGLIHP